MGKLAKTQHSENALAVAAEMDAMFGGGGFQIPIDAPLPQINILRETPMFETPDGETVKTVTGHIIYWHNANQYYEEEYGSGEPGAPTCCSSDGMKPDGGTMMQCQTCKDCPKNVYGSGRDGRGKACQNTIRMYVLADGDVIPSVIKATPASLGKKESLLKWLTNAPNVASRAGAGTHYQPIKVTFALHKKDFNSGFSASVLDLKTERVLDRNDEEDANYLKKLASLFKDFMASYYGRIASDVSAESANGHQPTESDDIPI
jgi:hypothetical protein